MPSFNWATCEIDMTDRHGGMYSLSSADLSAIPTKENATISFSHEYVHYLQALGSVAGSRMLGELVEIAVAAALLLDGKIGANGGVVNGYHPVLGTLQAQSDHAGVSIPVKPRFDSFMDEATALFGTQQIVNPGATGPSWEVVSAVVAVRSYVEPMHGFRTPSGHFRPFNIAFLAENMARVIDRWLAVNHGFAHAWPSSTSEQEVYCGLQNILSQPTYQHQVTSGTIDRVIVILCSLALGTPRPDASLAAMLERMAKPGSLGGIPATMALELSDFLRRSGFELSASAFNEVIDQLQHGPARCMARQEYFGVYEQLTCLQRMANRVLSDPGFFAQSDVTWDEVEKWVQDFRLPPVVASDGPVGLVSGVPAQDKISSLMTHLFRVMT